MSQLPPLDRYDSHSVVTRLTSQYPTSLLGVPGDGLRLSWQVSSTVATRQQAAQLSWTDGEGTWFDEPARAGEESIGVSAPGGVVPPGRERQFRVRIATEKGWTEWSAPLVVEAAHGAWSAQVISPDTAIEGPAPYVRREVELREEPVRARLRVSGLGVHDVYVNGEKVGDEHLAPGWTAYQERIVTATHDVTTMLAPGRNALGAILGDGWYRGRLGWQDQRAHYGERLGLIAELIIDYRDGAREVVATDGTWRWSTGRITMAGLYDGTDMDLALEPDGWNHPGFDDSAWKPVDTLDVDTRLFHPRIAPPIRTVAELRGELTDVDGRQQIDLGQNISGWLRITVEGRAGDSVVVRHAEVLEPDGRLHTAALRTARATDTYLLDRDGVHVLEPAFTFHGFQYAEVSGARLVEATGIAISSDTAPRGVFRSGHAMLDRLHENVVWSQRDNFVSVPTDCPQRDERLGWTGDAQAFAPTANTLFDSEAFWRSWLVDLEIDQPASGAVAAVVPNILVDTDFDSTGNSEIMGRAGWGDAATIVPWSVYESYGSDEVLVQQLDSMRRWVAHLEARATSTGEILLPSEFQFGDWLDPDAPGDRPQDAKTSGDFVANAFYSWSARLLARVERVVGDIERASAAEALADRVARATWSRWSDHASGTQTGCALAIELSIAPQERHHDLGERLAELVRRERGRIATGFLGTPLVLPALTRTGHVDEAYLMLTRTESPSWLYEVERGATTIWERWDAILPDGSIHAGDMDGGNSMISFNHYAYGAVIDWVYRVVAGIAPDAERPGYRRVRIAPRPAAAIQHVESSVDAPLGRVATAWRLSDAGFELTVELPFGTEGALDLPVTEASTVTINGEQATADRVLTPGTYRILVTSPLVAGPARQLASAA